MSHCRFVVLSAVLAGVAYAWPGDSAWSVISAPLDPERLIHGVAWDPVEDKIYLYGGIRNWVHYTGRELLDCYDPRSATWERMNHMVRRRAGIKGIYCRGKLYALGGWQLYFGVLTASCEAYDIERRRWRLIESLPTGRADYAAVVWRDSLIYVLGGFVSEGPPDVVDWVSVYDVYADTWHSATPMPLARWRFDACIIGDTIWSCVDSSILKGVIDADDPLHVTWQTYPGLAGLSTFEQPCVALRGRVVFWGRTTDSAQHQSVWVFDPATWEFDTLPAPPVSTISVCFAVARESAGELYKLAGDDNCDRRPYDATYYKLKVDFPEAVTEQTGSKTATPRQPLGTAVVRGRLLVNPEPASRQVSLHDVTGQKVADLKPGPCDISHLSPGIYFLRLGGSGRERIQKVVIAK